MKPLISLHRGQPSLATPIADHCPSIFGKACLRLPRPKGLHCCFSNRVVVGEGRDGQILPEHAHANALFRLLLLLGRERLELPTGHPLGTNEVDNGTIDLGWILKR